VYSKPPFGGPDQVLDYLGRYTHRVAISNHRLVSLVDRKVTFRWRDYKDGNKLKSMTLDAHEFIRRFLLHVLPRGFVRIRHYGFLANPHREQSISLCRQLLGAGKAFVPETLLSRNWMQHYEALTGQSLTLCPVCRQGHMVFVERIDASYGNRKSFKIVDTS
jgi:Putative transposase